MLRVMNTTTRQPLPVMPTVLVLEDNPDYRTLITEALTLDGFVVHAAPDGRRVNELLRTHQIDLVITDLVMPERDGVETLTALRYSHPHLPVIAISGDLPLNMHLYLTIAQKLGAARVLAKPFHMTELVTAARDALVASNRAGPTPATSG